MKVDISKKIVTLNNDKLLEEINKFECLTNQAAYLFMNESTMEALSIAISPHTAQITVGKSILCKYSGKKVFKNDDLEFGEVEIR